MKIILPVVVGQQSMSESYAQAEGFCGFDRYLVGSWKRTLQWRQFGGSFAHLRTSNSVVVVIRGNLLYAIFDDFFSRFDR